MNLREYRDVRRPNTSEKTEKGHDGSSRVSHAASFERTLQIGHSITNI